MAALWFRSLQNHRTHSGLGLGRHLCRSPAPTPMLKQGHLQPRGHWAPLRRAWLHLLCTFSSHIEILQPDPHRPSPQRAVTALSSSPQRTDAPVLPPAWLPFTALPPLGPWLSCPGEPRTGPRPPAGATPTSLGLSSFPPQGLSFKLPWRQLQEDPARPFLRPAQGPLEGSTTLCCIPISSQLGSAADLLRARPAPPCASFMKRLGRTGPGRDIVATSCPSLASLVGFCGKVWVAGGRRGGFCEKTPEAAPC